MHSKLELKGEGSGMTQALQWQVKAHRAAGDQFTPTVFVNDIEANAVSSGWTVEEWESFLSQWQ